MDNGIVNNLFNVVSAMSTTGLTTGIINDMYTKFGLIVLLVLIQLGAVGYMTLTSFFIISGSNRLSTYRAKILSAEFPLPDCFHIKDFIKNIVLYTFFIELIGILLYGGSLKNWVLQLRCGLLYSMQYQLFQQQALVYIQTGWKASGIILQ